MRESSTIFEDGLFDKSGLKIYTSWSIRHRDDITYFHFYNYTKSMNHENKKKKSPLTTQCVNHHHHWSHIRRNLRQIYFLRNGNKITRLYNSNCLNFYEKLKDLGKGTDFPSRTNSMNFLFISDLLNVLNLPHEFCIYSIDESKQGECNGDNFSTLFPLKKSLFPLKITLFP